MQPASAVLDTPRFSMRPPRGEDFDAWADFVADSSATRYLGGPVPRSVAWRSFLTMAGAWAVQGFAMFSVIEKSSGRWVGRVGPWYPDGWPGTEIGWGIVSDCWGRGYATEAATSSDRLGIRRARLERSDPCDRHRQRGIASGRAQARLAQAWRGPVARAVRIHARRHLGTDARRVAGTQPERVTSTRSLGR